MGAARRWGFAAASLQLDCNLQRPSMHAHLAMDGKADDPAAQQLQRQLLLLQQPPPRAEHRSLLRRLLLFLACFLVAFHFALTAYRVRHDPGDLAFVLAAYAMFALLFFSVAEFEAIAAADHPGASEARGRLRLCVWALSTALTVMFSARVTPIMPPPLNLVVCALALLVTVGGFLLLFVSDSGESGKWTTASSQEETAV